LRANPRTRLRGQTNSVHHQINGRKTVRRRPAERSGECSWFDARKTAVAVIKEYRHGLSEPGSSQHQVNGVVSIDIACFNLETSGRRGKSNELPPSCGKLKLNPVIRAPGATRSGLNAGRVWLTVSVKV
jgi:hypothetical protein